MHIYGYGLCSEDLELILQHVENLTTFAYIDRYGSNVTRCLADTLQRYAGDSLKELKLQCLPETPAQSQDIRINLRTGANQSSITCEALIHLIA